MIRLLNGILVIAVLVCGGWVYSLEHQSRKLDKRISSMKNAIAEEREAIRLLNAEWSHLNQPNRLEILARKHLQLAPTEVATIVMPLEIASVVPELEGQRAPGGGDPINDILSGKIAPTKNAVEGDGTADPIADILKGLQ